MKNVTFQRQAEEQPIKWGEGRAKKCKEMGFGKFLNVNYGSWR